MFGHFNPAMPNSWVTVCCERAIEAAISMEEVNSDKFLNIHYIIEARLYMVDKTGNRY